MKRFPVVLTLLALFASASFAQRNPTSFAGQYRAASYAYGLPISGAAAIVIGTGFAGTGAQTFTAQFGYTTLSDGTLLTPFNTNAPITVGVASTVETVTPSAVSCATPSVYLSCTVTATFTNAHGAGESVTSGTAGLQEAINAAAVLGGTAIVDGAWASAGGTQAMLNAATTPTNGTVAVADNRGAAGGLLYVTKTLTNAQVKACNSAPTSLLPAPGTTSFYDIQSVTLENVFLTAAYANGGVIQLSYGTGTTVAATSTVAATFLTSPAASQMVKLSGALASTLSSTILNSAIFYACATADFITGAGSMKVNIAYRVQTGL
jgi:hypothetical protein